MSFAAPIWLLALVPWAAVVLYLLWGRRPRVDVPFLELWPEEAAGVRVRRRASPPPIALALAILATLLAILAAGQPGLRFPGAGQTVSIVVDRGLSMSARTGNTTRLRATLLEAQQATRRAFAPNRRIELTIVPGEDERTDVWDWSTPDERFAPTALDTRQALHAAVRRRLLRMDGPVLVVSDQDIASGDERLIQIPPSSSVRNVRIAYVSARETPSPQVMVRVRGGGGVSGAKLRVSSGDGVGERGVTLPSAGEHDEFIDLPTFAQVIKAELLVDGDEQPADDVVWLVREASWPRLEARVPLPAHLQRMVEVYARQRPPVESSKRVVLVSSVEDLAAGEPGIVIAPATAPNDADPQPDVEPADHPIAAGLTGIPNAKFLATEAPPAAWTPIVTVEGKVWVAAREQPIRAVWVGFDSSHWARSSDFVVFWANVFNWAGAGGERFASYPVGSLQGDWQPVELAESIVPPEPKLWPGLYRRADGTLRALHAPDVPIPVPLGGDWRERLARLGADPSGQLALAPVIALLSLICLGLAALTWKRREPGSS